MGEAFLRNEMLLGPAALEKLSRSHVCVVGLGGVGGHAAEALTRSGVGELTLIDQDVYGESNLNRQLGALHSTIGLPKAEVLAERARDINPDCIVHAVVGRYEAQRREDFFGRAVRALGAELRELLPQEGTALVVGLGNRAMTPDAVGPQTLDHLLVTRHLLRAMPQQFSGLRPVAAVRTGVLATTGLESAELVRGAEGG